MANAIICHGVKFKDEFDKMQIPFCASFWYPWLQQKLIVAGIPTQVPSFTNSWLPARNYAADVDILQRQIINEKTILIGHSCGGGLYLLCGFNDVCRATRDALVAAVDRQEIMGAPKAPVNFRRAVARRSLLSFVG